MPPVPLVTKSVVASNCFAITTAAEAVELLKLLKLKLIREKSRQFSVVFSFLLSSPPLFLFGNCSTSLAVTAWQVTCWQRFAILGAHVAPFLLHSPAPALIVWLLCFVSLAPFADSSVGDQSVFVSLSPDAAKLNRSWHLSSVQHHRRVQHQKQSKADADTIVVVVVCSSFVPCGVTIIKAK